METAPLVPSVNRALYDGNLSLWWLLGAVLSLWFTAYRGLGILLGVLTPPSGLAVGPVFALHLVTCSLVSWICIWNLFHTPSHGPLYRTVHRVLGRTAMLSGLLSVIAGFYAAWVERYNPETLVFSIVISIGGILQLQAQAVGWYAIKRHDVPKHQDAMLVLFFYGCLLPMWLRLPNLVFHCEIPDWWSGVAFAIAVLVKQRAGIAHQEKRLL